MFKNLLDITKISPNFTQISSNNFNNRYNNIEVTGCHGAAKAYTAAKLFNEITTNSSKTINNRSYSKTADTINNNAINNNIYSNIAAIFPTNRDAIRFMDDLLFFMPEMHSSIIYFPGYHLQPFKSLSYHSKTASLRVSALYKLIYPTSNYFIITSIDTLLQKIEAQHHKALKER